MRTGGRRTGGSQAAGRHQAVHAHAHATSEHATGLGLSTELCCCCPAAHLKPRGPGARSGHAALSSSTPPPLRHHPNPSPPHPLPLPPLQAVAALLQDDPSAIVTLTSSGIDRPALLDGKRYGSYSARCVRGGWVDGGRGRETPAGPAAGQWSAWLQQARPTLRVAQRAPPPRNPRPLLLPPEAPWPPHASSLPSASLPPLPFPHVHPSAHRYEGRIVQELIRADGGAGDYTELPLPSLGIWDTLLKVREGPAPPAPLDPRPPSAPPAPSGPLPGLRSRAGQGTFTPPPPSTDPTHTRTHTHPPPLQLHTATTTNANTNNHNHTHNPQPRPHKSNTHTHNALARASATRRGSSWPGRASRRRGRGWSSTRFPSPPPASPTDTHQSSSPTQTPSRAFLERV